MSRSARGRANRSARRRNDELNKIPQIVRFSPAMFGFPDRLVSKLRYHDYFDLASAAGAVGTYNFRWNSIFDPNLTGTGHQPLYHDTYANIYDHYAVVSCKATVRIVNPIDDPWQAGVTLDDDTTVATDFNLLQEQSHSHSVYLTPQSGSRSQHTFVVKWDCMSILGVDPYTSQDYKTAFGSNPSEVSTLCVYGVDIDGNNTSLKCDILMEFTVLFTELQTPTIS